MDGVINALFAEVRRAELAPFDTKLCFRGQNGHEIGGEGNGAPTGLGADDLFQRDLHDAEIHLPINGAFIENVVQCGKIGFLALFAPFLLCLAPQLLGACILTCCFQLNAHSTSFPPCGKTGRGIFCV